MKPTRAREIFTGACVAATVTIALIATLYFAWAVIGLPFVPYDIFDTLTRILPGPVIAFGISTMVAVIRVLNIGPTAELAKLGEQTIAVTEFFVVGVIVGTILFCVVRRRNWRSFALIVAAVLAVPVILSSVHGRTSMWSPLVGAIWILASFLAWSMVIASSAKRTEVIVSDDRVERLDRRRFLVQLGGSAAVITVAGAVVGRLAETRRREAMKLAQTASTRWSANHELPNAHAAVQPAPGTRREFTPLENHYRIDINTTPTAIDEQTWRLKISGLVEKPLALTLDDIRRYESLHQFVTLACISNPVGGDLIGTTRWSGVSLQRLLADLKLQPSATHLRIHAADDFYEIVSLEAIRADPRIMLAYDWDGVPLTRDHGFPLRIYIPGLYGMKQPKWIDSIEVLDHWLPGYWVKRSWDKEARMKATSVIDTVAVDMTIIEADQSKRVPIGGIAHAGDRGISKVEVRVDDGSWEPAALRTPLSDLTWVIWRYDWPFQSGKHTFTVRCFDGSGNAQIETQAPPDPSGATGLHSKDVML